MTDWATPADVDGLTGETVSVADIRKAQPFIELFAGTTTDSSDNGWISTYNMRQLQRATAYQTVWMLSRPDLFTHTDVQGVSQDGVSAQYSHVNAALLAPLAKRYIDRLSWKLQPLKARTRRPRFSGQPEFGSLDSAAADDDRAWMPYQK